MIFLLYSLSVKNFAIIEDLKIDFKSGMTVLTGETGAGKSLIIDSISLLLGDRADSDMVRYGTDKAYIEGIFDYDNKKIDEILNRLGIKINDKIKIYREISLNGRNIIKVNDTQISLVELKNIKTYLADIHVQHDTFRLINPDTYISFIDNMEDQNFVDAFNLYQLSLDKYKRALNDFKSLEKKVSLSKDRLEFLIYEKNELEALDLYKDMDIALDEEISKLLNFDKIYKSLNEAYQSLDGEISSIDSIYNAYKSMDNISEYDKEYKEATDIIFDSYSNLDEIKSRIYKQINSLDYDDEELNNLQEKQKNLSDIMSKYKKSCNELIDELERITKEIALNENYDEVVKEYKENVIKAFDLLKDDAIKLTNLRKKRSKIIEKNLISECRDLELLDISFEIVFNDVDYSDAFKDSIFLDNGCDVVSFMISLNKGEPLKPLHKVASGGELSRIMLAFKSIFARESKLSLMVFDEIDTGVSGNAALQIALKMKKISEYSQVLCITHLPAVAAKGDYQMYISKMVVDSRTKTAIKELTYDERVEKIAMMIGGNQISKLFIEAARELLV